MMAFCPKCGTHNDTDSRFCQNCGGTLGNAAPPPPRQSAVPDAATKPGFSMPASTAGFDLGRLLARAKAIVLGPSQEWPVIAAETDQPKNVLMNYVAPLAAIGPIAAFVGMAVSASAYPSSAPSASAS
jgi:hypothetical protein